MTIDAILTSPALAGMRAVNQWIVYALTASKTRPGKTDKTPLHHVTGRPTGVNDPASWTDPHTAAAAARRLGPPHGVGFCFTEAAGWWFVDIDECHDGITWSPLAQQACLLFAGAAVEVSASGRGLHLFGRGAVPPHACKNIEHGAELYHADRFVALSGTSLSGDCMSDHTAAVQWWASTYFPRRAGGAADLPDDGPRADWSGPTDDAELLRRAMQSRSAAGAFGGKATFADLWHADAAVLDRVFPDAERGHDASSADAALAQHLAFWTGCDAARIERLMRQSPLARDKWDAREDYLPRTIAAACGQQRDVYHARSTVPLPPAAGLTLTEAVAQLVKGDAEQSRGEWLALALRLSRADAETFIDRVTTTLAVGRQALKATLREARVSAANSVREKALTNRAAGLTLIEWRPEASTVLAAEIEAAIVVAAAPGKYVSFAGVVSQITTKALPFTHLIDSPEDAPPDVPQIEPLDKVAMLQRAESVAVLFEVQASGKRKVIGMPDRLLEILIGKKVHAAPIVNGLVTHPIVLHDGSILATDGLHERSGMYLSGSTIADARAYSRAEAALALGRLRSMFLDGFEFATPLDADLAIAGLFTGVQRRMLDGAPGLAVLASAQSSGKTTLARRIHIILTGRDMPVSTFPLGDEAEVSKRLLSTLLRSPAMVCFDNIQDGFTFASGALAAAMTSSTFEQRVLGISRDASAPTSVLFALTGNNISLGNDEVTRWLVVRLAPKTSRPQERQFLNPDVMAHAVSVREQVLRDVVGIVAGFASARTTSALPSTRFPTWGRMVRDPLHWAGALDVAQVFRTNLEESEEIKAHRTLLWAIDQLHGDRKFKARDLASVAQVPQTAPQHSLRDALESLNVDMGGVGISLSIGKKLTALVGKVAEVGRLEKKLWKGEDPHDRIARFRVTLAGFAGF